MFIVSSMAFTFFFMCSIKNASSARLNQVQNQKKTTTDNCVRWPIKKAGR